MLLAAWKVLTAELWLSNFGVLVARTVLTAWKVLAAEVWLSPVSLLARCRLQG